MRTIYLVNGRYDMGYDDYRWWNVQAFNSKEDAERFIDEKDREYYRDMTRQNELDDKWDMGVITDEEKAEYHDISVKWMPIVERDGPKLEWYIKEIQFQE